MKRREKRQEETPSKTHEDVKESRSTATNHALVLALGVGLRVAAFTQSWPFSNRVELVTPRTSIARLQDGVALHRHGLDPYDGHNFHFQPLVLLFFRHCIDHKIFVFTFFMTLDVLAAFLFGRAANSFANEKKLSADETRSLVSVVCKIALLNPLSIGACAVLSVGILQYFLLALFVHAFFRRELGMCVVSLGLLSAHALFPAVLIVSLFVRFPSAGSRALSLLGVVLIVSLVVVLDFLVAGSSLKFLDATFGFIVTVPDLSPNVGLFWYVFTQVFSQFRLFFLSSFHIAIVVNLLPLAFTLRSEASLLLLFQLLLLSMFATYPSFLDIVPVLALLPLFVDLTKYMRMLLVVSCALVASVFLMPIMWRMWVVTGSGNANFYFAVSLVYNVAQIYLLNDLLFAQNRKELIRIDPDSAAVDAKFALS